MINNSIWLKDKNNKKIKKLKENIETDILIIGGGITGLSCAYFLKDTKYKISLVEKDKVGEGKTGHSTGKLTYLQGNIYEKIEKFYNKETAKNYLKSQKEACDLIKKIIIENNIKCDYESNNSYIFTNKYLNIKKLKNTKELLDKKYKLERKIPIKIPCIYSVKTIDTAVFNPYKYLIKLKDICKNNNINIYENTKIIKIEKKYNYYLAYTNKSIIKTNKIILACHYPNFGIFNIMPFISTIKKGYLSASIVDKNKRFNAINIDNPINSIRYYTTDKDYAIFLTNTNNLFKNIDNNKNYNKLIWKVNTTISNNVKYIWSNTDIETIDSLPLIGKINKDIFIGTGYNLWGLTNGTLAGKIIKDIIVNENNPYIKIFDPKRKIKIRKLPKLISINYLNAKNFIKSKLNENYNFYNNVKVIEKNGIKYGIYIDENKKEHIVLNKCPHMKCSLIFNEIEKTWDCPCHSSRFDIDGEAISGPSIYSISVEKTK